MARLNCSDRRSGLNAPFLNRTIVSCLGYDEGLKLVNKPTIDLENTMSNKTVKASLTSAAIAEQTAAFLKSGGAVEYVGKGNRGQVASSGPKHVKLQAR